jgi:hypothetical protein
VVGASGIGDAVAGLDGRTEGPGDPDDHKPLDPYRFSTPRTSTPCPAASFTTARMAGFMPGASPPEVRTAIRRMLMPRV